MPLLSKVYERFIYNQLTQHSEQFLKSLLCGFRQAHNIQHRLFKLLLSWLRELDSGGFVVTVLMDLSKAYDCISHERLIAKLECYSLDENSLKLTLSYLSHRKQRAKIGSSFGLTHILVSNRAQYLGRFFLIYLLMICFLML